MHPRDVKCHVSGVQTINNACWKSNCKNPTVTAILLLLYWHTGDFNIAVCHQTFNLFFDLSFYDIGRDYKKRLTTLGWHPTELIHTQWECPVCDICTNSPVMISKFQTGPRVGLWKPSMNRLTFCQHAWACWIIVQCSPVNQ